MNILIVCSVVVVICALIVDQQVEASCKRRRCGPAPYPDEDGDGDRDEPPKSSHHDIDVEDNEDRKPNHKEKHSKWKNGHKRIIGGKLAKVGQFPFVAGIKKDNGKILCTAVIISEKHILTAGHCFNRHVRPKSVFVGHVDLRHKGDDVQEFPLASFVVHESYMNNNTKHIANDIAIVKIDGKFKFGPNVEKMDLPRKNRDYPDGMECIQIGWGGTAPIGPKPDDSIYPYELSYADMKIFNITECSEKFTYRYRKPGDPDVIQLSFDKKEQICAISEKQSPYKGDSGGPLVKKADNSEYGFELVGLAGDTHLLKPVGHPALETKVSGYVDWILKNMETV